MDVKLEKPDAGDIDRSSLKPRPLADLPKSAGFSVVVPSTAWEQMHRHAHTRLDVEVGGVLVGQTFTSEEGQPYLLIEAIIPALAAESRETNITFTGEAWAKIHETIDRDHPGGKIVGWYHTHPAFGVFLSEMDVFICRHFFDLPHQVAIVIDPVAKTHGCFVWRAGVPTLGKMIVEGVVAAPSAAGELTSDIADAQSAPRPVPWSLRPRPPRYKQWIGPLYDLHGAQWFALMGLLVLAFLVFGALTMMWFNISPSELVERVHALASKVTHGGRTP